MEISRYTNNKAKGIPTPSLLRTPPRCWIKAQIVKRYLNLKTPNGVKSTISPQNLFLFYMQSQEPASTFKVKFAIHCSAPHHVTTLSAKPQSPHYQVSFPYVCRDLHYSHVNKLSTTLVLAPRDHFCKLPQDLATRMPRFELSRWSSSFSASTITQQWSGNSNTGQGSGRAARASARRCSAVTSSTTSTPACPSISFLPDYTTSFFNVPAIRGSQNVSQTSTSADLCLGSGYSY